MAKLAPREWTGEARIHVEGRRKLAEGTVTGGESFSRVGRKHALTRERTRRAEVDP